MINLIVRKGSLLPSFLLLATILLSGLPVALPAQEDLPVDQQLWLEYLYNYDLNKKIVLFGDVSYRTVFFKGLRNTRRIMARPSVRWNASDLLSVRGGLGVFYTSVNDTVHNLEIRPWQGLSVRWPTIGKQVFTQYFRFEERFTYNLDPWAYSFGFRLRYQISTRINFGKNKRSRYLYAPLAIEFFLAARSEKIFDFARNNSRFTVGIGYVINYRLAVEGRFVLQRSQLGQNKFGATDQIFRVMLHHNLFPIDPELDEVIQ